MRARKHAILHERCARRQNAILEHAGPVLGSALGKIGQGVNRGWYRPGETGGARGRGARGADFARGRGARVAGQRPPAPLPTLTVTVTVADIVADALAVTLADAVAVPVAAQGTAKKPERQAEVGPERAGHCHSR